MRKLEEHEIRLIAAGEVIERPASIVKELLENALDAGATSLRITVTDGGKDTITVHDDGCGMSREDALLALELHTTSKFCLVDGAVQASTYGFRGEALAALSSVASVAITTRTRENESGTLLEKAYNEHRTTRMVGCPYGTTIHVSGLFASIPARKKFLKSRETEWNALAQVIVAHACVNPSVQFQVTHDDRIIYQLPATQELHKRILAAFPSATHAYLIPCEYNDGYVAVTGMITAMEYGHYDRSLIMCSINGRPVKQYKMTQAIIKGYQGSLPLHRYPAAYLAITIDPTHVDMNVHPRKEEVAFLHPKKVEHALTAAVTAALEQYNKQRVVMGKPEVPITEVSRTVSRAVSASYVECNNGFHVQQRILEYVPAIKPLETRQVHAAFESVYEPPKVFCNASLEIQSLVPEIQISSKPLSSKPYYRGIIAKTYLLFDHVSGLLMIDQHALHERILYEKLRSDLSDLAGNALVAPGPAVLGREVVNILCEHEEVMHSLGISYDVFDETTLVVRGAPALFLKIGIEQTLKIIASLVKEDPKNVKDTLLCNVRATIACKAAIKAGDDLSVEQVKLLIDQMNAYEQVSVCPHGRPTSYLLRHHEIERLFKRT